jgi:predicted nucleic acid-binding protein
MMLCTSSLIAFCDQDDVWHKDKLLLVSEAFTEEAIMLVHHNARKAHTFASGEINIL